MILLLPKKPFAAQLGPSPNDGHAHGGGMDCLSKIFGTEIFGLAILLLPIRTDRMQARPKPERWSCPCRRHGLAIKNFRDRIFLDCDSVASYKKQFAGQLGPNANDGRAHGGGTGAYTARIGSETDAIDPNIEAMRLRCGADTARAWPETEAIDHRYRSDALI